LEEQAAVILAGDIRRGVISNAGKFPKTVRFGLGTRSESAHVYILEELIRARYALGVDCGQALEPASTRLPIGRSLARMARMARELNLLSEESPVYLARPQLITSTRSGV
jgi:hypothetical protein